MLASYGDEGSAWDARHGDLRGGACGGGGVESSGSGKDESDEHGAAPPYVDVVDSVLNIPAETK